MASTFAITLCGGIPGESSVAQTFTLHMPRVTDWECTPQIEDDGLTLTGHRVKATIEGILDIGQAAAQTSMNSLTVGGPVDGFTFLPDPAANNRFGVDWGDLVPGTVHATLTATRLVGESTALSKGTFVGRIELTALSRALRGIVSQDETTPVVSHKWSQEVDVAQDGEITRTVTGIITVRPVPGATTNPLLTTAAGQRGYADLLRMVVVPDPPGFGVWRRTRQQFGYSADGLGLTYTIVDKQARVTLPDGVWAADASFTWIRRMEDLLMPTVQFSVTVHGGPNIDRSRLIWAALVISTARIDYTRALVTSMMIVENSITEVPTIRLQVDAKTISNTGTTPNALASYPMLDRLCSEFQCPRTQSAVTPPHGTDLENGLVGSVMYMVPHWSDGTNAFVIPDSRLMSCGPYLTRKAKVNLYAPGSTPVDPPEITVAVIPPEDFSNATAVFNVGMAASAVKNSTSVVNGQTLDASIERFEANTEFNIETNIVEIERMHDAALDLPIQVGKPSVVVSETVLIVKRTTPPAKFHRPLPPGAMIVNESWKVTLGKIDASGNRSYIGMYQRNARIRQNTALTGASMPYRTLADGSVAYVTDGYIQPPYSEALIDSVQATPPTALGTLESVAEAGDNYQGAPVGITTTQIRT